MFTLRPATSDDVPYLEWLRRETIKPVLTNHREWKGEDQLKRVLADFDCAQIIVVDGRDAGLWKVVYREREIHLFQVQLDPQYQNRGIAGSLIRSLQREATTVRKPIVLEVFKSNPAVCLYEHLGFSIVREDSDLYEMVWKESGERQPNQALQTTPVTRSEI